MRTLWTLLRYALRAYGAAAGVFLLLVTVHALVAEFGGKVFNERLHAIYVAAAGRDAIADATSAKESAAESGAESAAGSLDFDLDEMALDLRHEIRLMARENERWKAEMNGILSEDLDRDLADISRQTTMARELVSNRDALLAAILPVLNELLGRREGWVQIPDLESFRRMLRSDAKAAGSEPATAEGGEVWNLERILLALREQTEDFEERSRRFQGLKPETLAAILAVTPTSEPGGASVAGPVLSEEQKARFLMTLEPRKITQVFSHLQEESPQQAAALMRRLLDAGGAQPSGG